MFKLVQDWKQLPKKMSVWFFALIFVSPELFQQLTAAGLLDGWLPPAFITIVKGLAVAGIIARSIKQPLPKENDDDEHIDHDKTIS